MFCSFESAPRIMRFFCQGEVVEAGDARFAGLIDQLGAKVQGARAVILLGVWKVSVLVGKRAAKMS